MGTIQILKNTALAATGLKTLYKDPLANVGTLIMLDFLRIGCWNGENPSATNNIAKDLSPNENNCTVQNPTAGATFSGGFNFGAGNTRIDFPSINMNGKSLVIALWYKWATQVASTAGFFGNLNNSINDGQFGLYAGTTHGSTLKARILDENGTLSGMNETLRASQTVGDIVLAGFIVQPGVGELVLREFYWDDTIGFNIKDSAKIASVDDLNGSIANIALGAINANGDRPSARFTAYRAFIEDVGVSGEEPIKRITKEWEKNRSRFS